LTHTTIRLVRISNRFPDLPILYNGELIFTRALKGYDLETQGEILNNIRRLSRKVSSRVSFRRSMSSVRSVASLREMHALQESGQAISKSVTPSSDRNDRCYMFTTNLNPEIFTTFFTS
jgi:hypothetical protein